MRLVPAAKGTVTRMGGGVTRDIYSQGVYFQSDSTTFSYAATCLADGLQQLGIPVFSNIDYHEPLISDFAFIRNCDPELPGQAACLLLDLQETAAFNNKMISIEPLHERFIALCMQDDVSGFCLQGPAAMLCAHENSLRELDGARIPIGFGVSSAMIRRALRVVREQPRTERFLHNFRPSLNQEVRACLDLVLVPALQQHFTVARGTVGGMRWSDEYFRLLASSTACLAYGGCFGQDLGQNDYFRGTKGDEQGLVRYRAPSVVLRWDSWRFWEALVFGCLSVQLDFREYGFKLPVMPENWQHYVGINLADVRRDVERLMDERARLSEIAWNGRIWALENYSPIAVARRFLATVDSLFVC